MGFFSKGMQIGLAEGFMDQQAESRDRQERLTEDKRKEMKAAQIRARKVLDEQEQDDQINLNITNFNINYLCFRRFIIFNYFLNILLRYNIIYIFQIQ